MLADVSQLGPFSVLGKLRHLVGVRFDEHSQPYGLNMVAEGSLCVYCNSLWIGIFMVILYSMGAPLWVFLPFALSAVAIVMSR